MNESAAKTIGAAEPRLEPSASPQRARLVQRWTGRLWPRPRPGVPILGYLLAPLLRPPHERMGRPGSDRRFSRRQTRLVDLVDPLHRPWDGESPASWPSTCAAERTDEFTVFASIAPTWVARCRGFRSRDCFFVPATAASITRMASTRRARRRAGFTYDRESRAGRQTCDPLRADLPTLQAPG